MPGSPAEAATGEGERPEVPEHTFLGEEGRLRTEALALSVETTPAKEAIEVSVELENVGAGHYVPSGLPDTASIGWTFSPSRPTVNSTSQPSGVRSVA